MSNVIGYVKIIPSKQSCIEISKCGFDIPYGIFEFYKNDKGDYQLESPCLMLLDKKLNHSICLYEGSFVYGGKVVQVSKDEIHIEKENKLDILKSINKRIKTLQQEKKKLLRKDGRQL